MQAAQQPLSRWLRAAVAQLDPLAAVQAGMVVLLALGTWQAMVVAVAVVALVLVLAAQAAQVVLALVVVGVALLLLVTVALVALVVVVGHGSQAGKER